VANLCYLAEGPDSAKRETSLQGGVEETLLVGLDFRDQWKLVSMFDGINMDVDIQIRPVQVLRTQLLYL
jgi:hypothetical protein